MRDFIIAVNSTVDVPLEWLKEREITVLPLKYTIDGETYTDMYGLSGKEFFAKLRDGKTSATSQTNPEEARELLEPFLKEGKDILYLGFSSALSGSFSSVNIACMELAETYPEAKIIAIDSMCACMGEAVLVCEVLAKKAEGCSIEEVAKWVEENRLRVCHNVTVDDLNYLQRGGRVSKTAAVLGTLIQIKPILHMDNEGTLQVIGKERGRKKSLNKIVDMSIQRSEGIQHKVIMITHGDCIEDAEYVAEQVRKRMGVENILIHNIGTVIGSHTGPGVVAVFHMGNYR